MQQKQSKYLSKYSEFILNASDLYLSLVTIFFFQQIKIRNYIPENQNKTYERQLLF